VPRRSRTQVADSRAVILRTAVQEASVRGFEAASIGNLAAELGMSKSGLIRHFGDKEQLQIATFRAGVELFTEHVWRRVEAERPGLVRLLALCDAWLDYHTAADVLPGGCLMTTAVVEFDARNGRVHETVEHAMRLWHAVLAHEAARAMQDGDLPADADPADIAFALNALASSASTMYRLYADPAVLARARRLMRRTLGRLEDSPAAP
jgi:AcrR family transcriptional regulator